MTRRHPVPSRWLITDERLGDRLGKRPGDLLPILARLPRGTGVVFRHHGTPADERARLLASVRRIAARRGLVLTVAGESHGRRTGRLHRFHSWPAHDRSEARRGAAAGAAVLLVSPVFATRSHPGARGLGPRRAAAIGRSLGVPLVALGGMNERRFQGLRGSGFSGWAGIDAFAGRQKRKAVPT